MTEHRVDMYRFRDELERLAQKKIPHDPVLFYGSSTFGMWKDLEETFAAYRAVNFGFGGSTSDEALFHYEWLAKPTAPRVMVWYFGDNEPVCGYTAAETKELFAATWDRFFLDFPGISIITIATKTSPARNEYAGFVHELNAWQKAYASQRDNLFYVETADICQKDGAYLLPHYLPDRLHFSAEGYALLAQRVKALLDQLS